MAKIFPILYVRRFPNENWTIQKARYKRVWGRAIQQLTIDTLPIILWNDSLYFSALKLKNSDSDKGYGVLEQNDLHRLKNSTRVKLYSTYKEAAQIYTEMRRLYCKRILDYYYSIQKGLNTRKSRSALRNFHRSDHRDKSYYGLPLDESMEEMVDFIRQNFGFVSDIEKRDQEKERVIVLLSSQFFQINEGLQQYLGSRILQLLKD